MKCFCLLLLFCIGTLQAEDSRKELSEVEQEINALETEIHRLRIKSLGAELKGNEYMHAQWGRYVDQIEKSETYDVDILKMEKQLELLKKKRQELLIQYKIQQGSINE